MVEEFSQGTERDCARERTARQSISGSIAREAGLTPDEFRRLL